MPAAKRRRPNPGHLLNTGLKTGWFRTRVHALPDSLLIHSNSFHLNTTVQTLFVRRQPSGRCGPAGRAQGSAVRETEHQAPIGCLDNIEWESVDEVRVECRERALVDADLDGDAPFRVRPQ